MSYKYCPHCGGALPPPMNRPVGGSAGELPAPIPFFRDPQPVDSYDQTEYWREVVSKAQAVPEGTTVTNLPEGFTKGATIIHMVFDKSVSPQGGLMKQLIQNVASTQSIQAPRLTPAELDAMGYLADAEGKVVLVDDIPVGRIYGILRYWGGEKQHKRWHMASPVIIDPSRKGDPCFIDDNLAAIKVIWKDGERMSEALTVLADQLREGVKDGKGVGAPRLVDVCWVK